LRAPPFPDFAEERPPTSASPAGEKCDHWCFEGLRHALHQRDFLLVLAIFFIGLGVSTG
jgi:hypothetical protein